MQLHTVRKFGFHLVVSMFLSTFALPAVAQSAALQPQTPTSPSCAVSDGDRPCPANQSTSPSDPRSTTAPLSQSGPEAQTSSPSSTAVTYRAADGSVIMVRSATAARPVPTPTPEPWYNASTPRAHPDSPDPSELLKNSKDRDFILRNFKTMYVDAQGAEYFGADQMKAALYGNGDFQKLNIRIVDDRRVADVVLVVGYTFAWDYPFELRHQNTTMVLLAGKGEGPFSGPLGAADVARQFSDLAKPWRTVTEGKK